MNKKELWDVVLAQIELNTSEVNFTTWFKDTSVYSVENNKIIIAVPNTFVKEWLSKNYNKKLLEIIKKTENDIKKIDYIIKSNIKKNYEEEINNNINDDDDSNVAQMNFQDINIDYDTGLNSKYTFDNYIVGSFNNLAHAASFAISESPGSLYNPLFIYSKSGLGKTHLLQAIGNKIRNTIKNKKVFYIQGQEFVDNVINSLRNNSVDDFKRKYKDIDVLIIDDIQFLSNKEKTQELFFHTFNDLYSKDKQIILSSDRPPKEISALADRLRTRFEGGMMADISYPDVEIRAAILKEKAKQKNFIINNDVCYFIAENIQRNIRELEGVLNKIVIYEKINKKPINIEVAKEILKNITQTPIELFSFNKILKTVANFYEIEERDIIGKSRKKEFVKSRQVVIYFLRKELSYSYPYISQKIGKKDHTTIIHSFKKIEGQFKKDKDIRDEILCIKERIISCG